MPSLQQIANHLGISKNAATQQMAKLGLAYKTMALDEIARAYMDRQRAIASGHVATFTNGVPNSAATNFTAAINWGDNATNIGVITTNLNWKVVRGTHTYTNAGIYPVYVTVRSALGAMATVVATATIPPTVALRRTGTNNVVRWPAWAAEYQVQTNTSLTATNWASPTNLPAMVGYDNVITNTATNQNLFFRLKK